MVREAEQPVKPTWRPMLRFLAGLHGRSVLPAVAHFKYAYESIGPGYQDGRVFGHIELTHAYRDYIGHNPLFAMTDLWRQRGGAGDSERK